MQDFQANASTTLIGSMPHRDRDKAIELILREIPEIPVWPQLPAFVPEQMLVQYLEGLPGVRTIEGRTIVKTDSAEFEQELYGFYEEYLEVESGVRGIEESRFKLGPDTGKTFFRFLEAASGASSALRAVKGQITGPFTLLAGLKDQQDRALLYDERMQDAVVKQLAMKARWQILHLSSIGCPVIIFLDEPALAGYGSSAFISVSAELIHQLLSEVVDAAHQAGAMAGIHVCANTDWHLAFDSEVDIINFDAYSYFDKFTLYNQAFAKFMAQGRIMAWGIVPTGDKAQIEQESAQSLATRWLENVKALVSDEVPLRKILQQSIFTPSCGCGSLSESTAERVVQLTRDVGSILRAHL